MNPFINQQNKRHYFLFKEEDKIFGFDSQITWLDVFLVTNAEKLNKCISKISPRKSKIKVRTEDELDETPNYIKRLMNDGI